MMMHGPKPSSAAETPQSLLQMAVEKTALVAWSTDRELRITSFHAPTRCSGGKPDDHGRGMTLSTLFQTNVPDSQPLAVHRRALEGESGSFPFDFDGRPYRANVFPHRDGEDHIIGCLGFAQVVAVQKETEAALELNESRLNVLLKLAEMTDASDQEIGRFVVEEAVRLTSSKIGFLHFVNEDETATKVACFSRGVMAECAIPDVSGEFIVNDCGLWAEAIRQRRAIVVNDYAAPNDHKKGLPQDHFELTRLMSVPAFAGRRIVAVAAVANKLVDYNESDVRQITLLLQGMWKHVARRRAEDELREHRDRLDRLVGERTAELSGVNEQLRQEIADRIQTERALTASRQELDAIFENAPVAMVLVDRDRRVKKANRAAAQVAGRCSPDEMVGLCRGEALRCVHALDVPEGGGYGPACKDCQLRSVVQETIETGKVHRRTEALLRRELDGRSVETFVCISAARIGSPEEDLILVCVEDVTGRKRLKNALKEQQEELENLVESRTRELATSEARYRCLVEQSPAVIHVYSTRRGGVYYSPRVETVFGYTVDHLLANPFLWNESIHPDDRPRVQQAIQEAKRLGTFEVEYRVKDARGEWIWLHDSSVAVRSDEDEIVIEGLAQDMTPRKRAEESLRESTEKLHQFFEQSIDGIWQLDLQGKIVFTSAATERMYGYALGETTGMSLPELFPESELPRVYQAFEQVLSGDSYQSLEFDASKKDGSIMPVELSASPIKRNGQIIGAQGIIRDVSARKQKEEELRESQRRLQESLDELRTTQEQVVQQERLRALGEMASGVGHDLNNSLSPVLGYSEMLLEDTSLPGSVREFLKWIRNGARDAATVVARLREFYRPSGPGESRRPVELAALLEEVVQLTRPKWRDEAQREGRKIECHARSDDAPLALGNAAEIREVLTNLIFNAVDAMPSGGRIELRFRGESGGAVVEVADTGVGMSDEVRAKCLEPFFTTKD
ncbi:MAG: PAS domain S-box protein, partial [Planctomycetes bacterium]|nr:PAS domain S-box protein [Planctomycetota bacterium]